MWCAGATVIACECAPTRLTSLKGLYEGRMLRAYLPTRSPWPDPVGISLYSFPTCSPWLNSAAGVPLAITCSNFLSTPVSHSSGAFARLRTRKAVRDTTRALHCTWMRYPVPRYGSLRVLQIEACITLGVKARQSDQLSRTQQKRSFIPRDLCQNKRVN